MLRDVRTPSGDSGTDSATSSRHTRAPASMPADTLRGTSVNAPGLQQARFNGDPLFAQSAHVGMDGRLGKIALGRNPNPYFVSTLNFNAFRDSFYFSPMLLHTFIASGLGRPLIQGATLHGVNALLYTTPPLGGFTGNVIYALG